MADADDSTTTETRGSHTRSKIVEDVMRETGQNHRDATRSVQATQDSITRALARGERVMIFGLGTFHPKVVAPRLVQNPATGKKTKKGKTGRVLFRASPVLREYVAGTKKLPKGRLVTEVVARRKPGKSKQAS